MLGRDNYSPKQKGDQLPHPEGPFPQVKCIHSPVPFAYSLYSIIHSSLCGSSRHLAARNQQNDPNPSYSLLSKTPGPGLPQFQAPDVHHGKCKVWMAPQPGRTDQGGYSRWIPLWLMIFHGPWPYDPGP